MAAKKSNDRVRAFVNKNFVIRITETESKRVFLVGAGQYHKYVGEELKTKHFAELSTTDAQVVTKKLRRGLKIEFHSK